MVRLALSSDAERVRFVVRTVHEEYGWPWDPGDYHADLVDFDANYLTPDSDFFVAEVEGLVVGAGGLVTHATVPGTPAEVVDYEGYRRIAGTDCEVVRLYLLAEHRGKGLGRALNDAIIGAARARKKVAMEIWSDKRLHEAHRLYQSCGAKLVGERICDDPDQSPEWGFYLEL